MYIFVCVLEVLRLWILNMVEHGLWCHGASSLGMRREVKMRRGWEREVRRGKILSNKFSEKWSLTGEAPTVITSLRWMGQCIGKGAYRDSLFTGLSLSHGWWVLKTSEMCFHFPSSSLIFLSNRITKTGSPNMSHGVQTRCFSWAPSILDHKWWKQDYIT